MSAFELERRARALRPAFDQLELRELLSGPSATSNQVTLGINLNAVDYWTTALMFNDVMNYTNDGWNVVRASSVGYPWNISGATLPTMDQNGYPVGLGDLKDQGYGLMTYAFTQPITKYPTGNYTLIFDGKGTVVVTQLGGSQASGTFTQGSGVGLPHAVNIAGSKSGIEIAITDSDPTDYVRNIRLIMPGYQENYQSEPFYTPFLQGLEPFSTLRFMDTMRTNDQSITDWADRTTASYRTQTKSSGVAVEYMVDLANTLHKDMWVNMPYKADDAYVRGFSQYVQQALDPALNVYVEYGNEVWNGGPGFHDSYQYVYDYSVAHHIKFPQAVADLSKHDWDLWRETFGNSSSRIIRVAATQFSNPWLLDQELARLVATADPEDRDHGFEVVSGAPYFTPNSSRYDASTTTQQIVADALAATKIGNAIDAFMAVRDHWEQRLGQVIPAIMYEGGFALTASPSDSWYDAYLGTQTDPGMYQVTMAYLDCLYQHGVDGLMYYNYVTPIGAYGPWGAMQYVGEPEQQAPKYHALVDYVAEHAFSAFSMDGLSSSTVAGQAVTFTVTARDALGNVIPDYAGRIHFTSSDGLAVLPSDYTFQPSDRGAHTFTVTFKTAGSQDLRIQDLNRPQAAGGQAAVSVTPAAPATFNVAGPSGTVAGQVATLTVTVRDAYGNTVSSYLGTVSFSSSDVQAGLPSDYAFTAADGGVRTFPVILKTSGSQSVRVTDSGQSSLNGSAMDDVTPAAASAFVVSGYPSPVSSGNAQVFGVTAYDPFGNVATGYRGTVHFQCTDSEADLPADYSFTSTDNGAHTFSATLRTQGTESLAVADLADAQVNGTQAGIVVGAPVSALVLTGAPLTTVAGTAFAITITAKDAQGKLVPTYTGTVHFKSTDPRAVLPEDYTFDAADRGQHTFVVTLNSLLTQVVSVNDVGPNRIAGASSVIVVIADLGGLLGLSGSGGTSGGGSSALTACSGTQKRHGA